MLIFTASGGGSCVPIKVIGLSTNSKPCPPVLCGSPTTAIVDLLIMNVCLSFIRWDYISLASLADVILVITRIIANNYKKSPRLKFKFFALRLFSNV